MRENIIKNKSFNFAILIVNTNKSLKSKKEFILSKQLLRSGTAIGALVRETEQAESKKDFIHKLATSLKETNETEYWIELLYKTSYMIKNEFEELTNPQKELLKLLTTIIRSTKSNFKLD